MLGFGKPKINDPYNTMGTAPAQRSRDRSVGSSRPRTPEDNARYDAITRNAIRNMKDGEWAPVNPAEFTSTVDYLKWCDRTGERGAVWDSSLPTGGVSKPNLYDEVKQLRGK